MHLVLPFFLGSLKKASASNFYLFLQNNYFFICSFLFISSCYFRSFYFLSFSFLSISSTKFSSLFLFSYYYSFYMYSLPRFTSFYGMIVILWFFCNSNSLCMFSMPLMFFWMERYCLLAPFRLLCGISLLIWFINSSLVWFCYSLN